MQGLWEYENFEIGTLSENVEATKIKCVATVNIIPNVSYTHLRNTYVPVISQMNMVISNLTSVYAASFIMELLPQKAASGYLNCTQSCIFSQPNVGLRSAVLVQAPQASLSVYEYPAIQIYTYAYPMA